MSSYLSKLAARAVEQPQPIRPRLASLFEPVAGPKIHWTETTANKRARRIRSPAQRESELGTTRQQNASEANLATIEHNEEGVGTKSQAPRERNADLQQNSRILAPDDRSLAPTPTLAATEITNPALEQSSLTVEATQPEESSRAVAINPTPPIRDETPAVIQITPSITLEETTVIETSVQADSSSTVVAETTAPQSDAAHASTVIVKPRVATGTAPTPNTGTTAPAPEGRSSIRITIGRVEVRAVMPQPQPATPTRQAAASSALSLDEYLKRRNGA